MKTKIYVFLIFISFSSFAQEMEPIQTDRPDQTETPALTPKESFRLKPVFHFIKTMK